MMPQLGYQLITKLILTNISKSKGNQTMKFGQLIEYSKKNIFSSKIMQKVVCSLVSIYFDSPKLGIQ